MANILPDQNGDLHTIKQALKYTKSVNEHAQVILIFNIRIQEQVVVGVLSDKDDSKFRIYPNPTTGLINWDSLQDWQLVDATGHEFKKGNDTSLDL